MADLGPEDENLMIEGLRKMKNTKRPYATNTKRRTYTLPDDVHTALVKLGKGNASAGIREAVRLATK
jgi:hypothetical protein